MRTLITGIYVVFAWWFFAHVYHEWLVVGPFQTAAQCERIRHRMLSANQIKPYGVKTLPCESDQE